MEEKYIFHSYSPILSILSNWEKKSIWSSEKFELYEEVYIHQMYE